jgi:uncharacterized membrane protein
MTTFSDTTTNTVIREVTPLSESEVYYRAIQIGIVAGLRSMMPLALLTWSKERREQEALSQNRSKAMLLTGLLALGEIVGDKLQIMPSRVSTGSLLGRIASGAIAGAVLSNRYGYPLGQGAIRGTLGAGLGAFAGYSVRLLLSQTLNIPDVLLATIEDSIALSLGLQAVKNPENA